MTEAERIAFLSGMMTRGIWLETEAKGVVNMWSIYRLPTDTLSKGVDFGPLTPGWEDAAVRSANEYLETVKQSETAIVI